MKKKVVFEAPMCIGLFALATAHFMGMCVNGLCSEDWLIKNLMLGFITEIVLFYYLRKSIKSGGFYLYLKTKNPEVAINYYKKIRGFAIIAAAYAVILWFQPRALDIPQYKGTFTTTITIIIFALSVYITTTFDINRIKNRR